MRSDQIACLTDCTEFRQTLQARPPRIVHGTTILLALLLGTALLWAALTEADLVVRASGVVRPVTATQVAKTRFGGRIVTVGFREGEEVKKGHVLVQFDTEKLDNDIKKRELTIRAGEEELAKGATLLETISRQYQADKATIEAKLAQALDEVFQANKRRDLDIRQAADELKHAQREESMLQTLLTTNAVALVELDKAKARVHEARTKLAKAKLPVEEGKVTILRQELAQAAENYAAKRQELEMKQVSKSGEVQAARKDLDNLKWERDQACIYAPIDGVVVSGDLKADEILEAGKVVAEIAVQKGFRFEATVPSEEVGHLQEGMPVRIKLDPFDYQKYGTLEGMVCFLSPDSKVLEQRGVFYTVKIDLEREEVARGEFRGRVKLGMSGQAEIVTQRESILMLLVKKVRQSISLG
jgi:multidrug resistance efflux pump